MYDRQIQVIQTKLDRLRRLDQGLTVFGAQSHRYLMAPPATMDEVEALEAQLNITLPPCYTAFVTRIGNGGQGRRGAAPGPGYGIYPLGHFGVFPNPPFSLANGPVSPLLDLTAEAFSAKVNAPDLPDDDTYWDAFFGRLFSGMIDIADNGCCTGWGLIVTGDRAGRVVVYSEDIWVSGPGLTKASNFLDWYEGWLDKALQHCATRANPTAR